MIKPVSDFQDGWRGNVQRGLVYFGLAEDPRESAPPIRYEESWLPMVLFPLGMAALVGGHRDALAGWIVLAAFVPTTVTSAAVRLRAVGTERRELADSLAIPAVMLAGALGLASRHASWSTILLVAAGLTFPLWAAKFVWRPAKGMRRR